MFIGGVMNIVKKISCKVVRSVPLEHGRGRFEHWSRQDNDHRNSGQVASVNSHAGHISGSFTYTSRRGKLRISIDNNPAGQLLDCYL